jgi:hypothetical protein
MQTQPTSKCPSQYIACGAFFKYVLQLHSKKMALEIKADAINN